MYWKSFKVFVIVAVIIMAIAPFLYQSESDVEISDVSIREKTKPIAAPNNVETPLHNIQLPDFAAIKGSTQRKQAFFDYLKPTIDAENAKLFKIRSRLVNLNEQFHFNEEIGNNDEKWLKSIAKKYSVDTRMSMQKALEILLIKVDIIPRGLVLVQAANESAWGSSRFARIGLNFFGMWCFKKGCGLVPNGRTAGLNHEVAAFKSIEQMVERYCHNLNTNSAYILFRSIRNQLRINELELEAHILATGLLPYSERGIDYIVELNKMLVSNARFINN